MEHREDHQPQNPSAGLEEQLECADRGDDRARLAALEDLSESIEAELEEVDQTSPPGR